MSNNPQLNQFTFTHKGMIAALWITGTATIVRIKRLQQPLAHELMTYAPGLLGKPTSIVPTPIALIHQLVRILNTMQSVFSVGKMRKGNITQQEIIEGAAALKLLNGFCQGLHVSGFYQRAGLRELPEITLKESKELDEALDALAGQPLPSPLRHL